MTTGVSAVIVLYSQLTLCQAYEQRLIRAAPRSFRCNVGITAKRKPDSSTRHLDASHYCRAELLEYTASGERASSLRNE